MKHYFLYIGILAALCGTTHSMEWVQLNNSKSFKVERGIINQFALLKNQLEEFGNSSPESPFLIDNSTITPEAFALAVGLVKHAANPTQIEGRISVSPELIPTILETLDYLQGPTELSAQIERYFTQGLLDGSISLPTHLLSPSRVENLKQKIATATINLFKSLYIKDYPIAPKVIPMEHPYDIFGRWCAIFINPTQIKVLDLVDPSKEFILTAADMIAFAFVTIDKSGSWLALKTRNKDIELWDLTTGTRKHILAGNIPTQLYFNPSGRWLVENDQSSLTFWHLPGAEKSNLPYRILDNVVDRSGKWIATEIMLPDKKTELTLWNLFTGEKQQLLTIDNASIRKLLFDPTGKWLAAQIEKIKPEFANAVFKETENEILLYNTLTGEKKIIPFNGFLSKISFNSTGTLMYYITSLDIRQLPERPPLGLGYDEIQVWDMTTLERKYKLDFLSNSAFDFDPTGSLLVGVFSDKIRIWDAATGRERTINHPLKTGYDKNIYLNHLTIAFNSGSLLAIGFQKEIQLWDLASGEKLKSFKVLRYVNSLSPKLYFIDEKTQDSLSNNEWLIIDDTKRIEIYHLAGGRKLQELDVLYNMPLEQVLFTYQLGKALYFKTTIPLNDEQRALYNRLPYEIQSRLARAIKPLSVEPKS